MMILSYNTAKNGRVEGVEGGKRIVNNFCDLLVLVENFYSLGG